MDLDSATAVYVFFRSVNIIILHPNDILVSIITRNMRNANNCFTLRFEPWLMPSTLIDILGLYLSCITKRKRRIMFSWLWWVTVHRDYCRLRFKIYPLQLYCNFNEQLTSCFLQTCNYGLLVLSVLLFYCNEFVNCR